MTRKLAAAALLAMAALAIAGCGSQRRDLTTHAVIKIAKQPTPKLQMRTCSTGVMTNVQMSCLFAENLLAAYGSPAAEKEEEDSETATVHLMVGSREVTCAQTRGKVIDCHARVDVVVTLTFAAVVDARARAQGQHLTFAQARIAEGVLAQRPFNPTRNMTPAQRGVYEADQNRKAEALRRSLGPSGLWGAQSRAENEEAGCKYGFTVDGEKTTCNTQEEGKRIQEAMQRERENPQRAAENEQAGAEARSHEECVIQNGVEAC
jgi:hypothetical protein